MSKDIKEKTDGEVEERPVKGKRKRSPNHPVVNLEEALRFAGDLFKNDSTHFVPIDLLHERWGGLAKMGGRVLQLVAALKAYGLIDVEGQTDKRKVRVSELAEKVLDNHPNKQSLIRQAALLPEIYSEIWNKYKVAGLPKDDVLDQALRWGEGLNFQFENKDARELLLQNFTQTIKFAKLDFVGEVKPPINKQSEIADTQNDPAITDKENMSQSSDTFKPPILSEEFATIQIPNIGFLKIVYPITKKKLTIIKNILGAIDVDLESESSDGDKQND